MDEELSKVAMGINAQPRTIDGYALNAHDWDQVVTNATTAHIFPGGTNAEDYLRDLTSSPEWKLNQSAPDGGQFRNGQLVQRVLDTAYQYGRDQYKADHPELAQAKQAEQLQRFERSIPQTASDDSQSILAPAKPVAMGAAPVTDDASERAMVAAFVNNNKLN